MARTTGTPLNAAGPHAVADLKAISEYIEQDRSLETANRVARAITVLSRACVQHRIAADTGEWKTPARAKFEDGKKISGGELAQSGGLAAGALLSS